MSKRTSYIVIAVFLILVAVIVLGGGSWMWNVLLRMHGMKPH